MSVILLRVTLLINILLKLVLLSVLLFHCCSAECRGTMSRAEEKKHPISMKVEFFV
jgi:hypothetical protein